MSLSQSLLSNTTHARSLYSQELLTQRPFTKRYRDVRRKYFINKCTQMMGRESAETLTHKKNKNQPNKKHFRSLQHSKMLRSVKEPSEMKPRSYFMHNVTYITFIYISFEVCGESYKAAVIKYLSSAFVSRKASWFGGQTHNSEKLVMNSAKLHEQHSVTSCDSFRGL